MMELSLQGPDVPLTGPSKSKDRQTDIIIPATWFWKFFSNICSQTFSVFNILHTINIFGLVYFYLPIDFRIEHSCVNFLYSIFNIFNILKEPHYWTKGLRGLWNAKQNDNYMIIWPTRPFVSCFLSILKIV